MIHLAPAATREETADTAQLPLDRLQFGGHPLNDLLLNLGLLQVGRPGQALELLQHPQRDPGRFLLPGGIKDRLLLGNSGSLNLPAGRAGQPMPSATAVAILLVRL